MTRQAVPFERLISAREELVAAIHAGLMDEDREFLISVKTRQPRWNLLGLPGIADLPAVRWKLLNLGRMSRSRHAAAVDRFETSPVSGNRRVGLRKLAPPNAAHAALCTPPPAALRAGLDRRSPTGIAP